ncbi:MAG: TRZ/ATZ family hydrolase [Gammaproteobacteria bacterium]|nr:TRZ/ATZ family hydrolase [Gammaproteobacteria bacterium]MDH5652107.1 TRZ/ATZ family hydrolase [Gammaproteobacteria bacterium]
MQIDTLISARWIVPVEPRDVVLHDHSLAIHDGRISAIVPNAQADQFSAVTRINLPNHVLLPGLINCHGHAAMTLMRGMADDLPLMDWLNNHIWPAEQKFVNAEFAYDGSLLAGAEMLRGGTTCFNDMYFYPEETARSAEQLGIRAVVGLIVINFPSAWAADADDYIAKGLELHDQLQNNPLISTAFAPHAPYTVSNGPLERIRTLSAELDIPIHIHVHETLDEINQSVQEYGQRPLARLEQMGLLNPNLVSVHMTQLTDEEIALYAECGGHIVHCPESNLKLASGFCPLHKLHQAGINLALGTDGAASNNDLDMFGEMRTAALLAKAVANDAGAMPAGEILRMATINGARALGLEHEIGSLEIGKAADVIAVNLSGIETEPVYKPVSQLVYATNRERVTDVWVAGRHLVKDRDLTTLAEHDLLSRVRNWQQKLAD